MAENQGKLSPSALVDIDTATCTFFFKDCTDTDRRLSKAICLQLHGGNDGLSSDLLSLVHELRSFVEQGKIRDVLERLAHASSCLDADIEIVAGLTVWIYMSMANWSWLAENLQHISAATPGPVYLTRLLFKYLADDRQKLGHIQSNGAGWGVTEEHLLFSCQRRQIDDHPEIYLELSKAFLQKKGFNANYFNTDSWVLETINTADMWDRVERKTGAALSVNAKDFPAPLPIEQAISGMATTSMCSSEAPGPRLVEIDNVVLFSGEWHVRAPEGVLISDLYVGTPHHSLSSYGSLSQQGFDAMLLYRNNRPSIDSAFIAGGDDNYYHWIHDVLPRVCWYSVDADINAPLLTGVIQKRFQKEILSILGVEDDNVITMPYPEVANVARAFIPLVSPQNRAFRPRYSGVRRWAHDYFGRLAVPDYATAPWAEHSDGLRLYVKRGEAQRRRLINEEEVCIKMHRLGFQIIDPDVLSVQEQVRLFNKASVVVSPHGAALANLCFCRPRTRVVELAFPTWAPFYFRQIALERELVWECLYLRQAPDLSTQEHFYNGYLPLDLLGTLAAMTTGSRESQ